MRNVTYVVFGTRATGGQLVEQQRLCGAPGRHGQDTHPVM